MKNSDMIRQLCEQMNISVSELARRLGQSPQNFGKKLKRETITLEELKSIADVMEVKFEQSFILPNGKEIRTGSGKEAMPMNEVQRAFDSLSFSRINQISFAAGKGDPNLVVPPLISTEDWIVYSSFLDDYEKNRIEGKTIMFETPFD